MFPKYDIIVVGAGHAGCEAAAASANMGAKTLLITMNMTAIAQMSCNPAMGGVAKGQLVREIDALGGFSGIITDKTMIQFKMLNLSKGPAMWSPRAQNDRWRFSETWRLQLEKIPNIDFWQDSVVGLIIKDGRAIGVKTENEHHIYSKAVVLTNGTFLNGLIHIGEKQITGGRVAERASSGITEQLVEFSFKTGRMKTGTPPRIDGRTINYSSMEPQEGDENPSQFSYTDTPKLTKQKPCWLTYTNKEVHEILKTGFDKSPMFTGRIKGLGPRYCPSIEDKINRFSHRERHILFIEPEGWDTVEVYLNGFSTSLPAEVQDKALKKIPGFENCKMFRPGYAIEYDYFPPDQLDYTLETKLIENLFFAGQINGTTGYEEAASQGLMAGINAVLKIREKNKFLLGRDTAYIGVLIDDLINKGTEEPYRMFTSRAEFRMSLRQDNADIRLSEKGHALGLISDERLEKVNRKITETERIITYLKSQSIDYQLLIENVAIPEIPIGSGNISLLKLISMPQVNLKSLASADKNLNDILINSTKDSVEQAEIQIKYEFYINREKILIDKLKKLENLYLKNDLDYSSMKALSSEGKEKLLKIKPSTLGQASRISGVTPSDISILLMYMNAGE
ncbi:MAG: tRNA uridine-5-carboxymethylaminomethyl(34) synthesis enzyme MnmG [Bacteroidetes bacterium RIFCSPLOWO2_02_FULL_36_8]|nr:MAG: tRNA uridine-5-carboxymethylaminomethyl(34) synthesis enzyme MnmG [Bacteroidetes bacterium RIFCSPLOWO2_02_FULL_36_8]OFY69534.1 MAG: tRNA uridine-5-carboxymethylaminomethyl(34) synthesis enzyme MnmG [Bacteroidetes bacterium RIFCSPLOWO2_12_FULL_37_12]